MERKEFIKNALLTGVAGTIANKMLKGANNKPIK